jgi:hypothetical protein
MESKNAFKRDADLVTTYVETLGDLVDTIADPVKDQLPSCLSKLAGVLSWTGEGGGLLLNLLGTRHQSIVINDQRIFLDPKRPIQAHLRAMKRLEAELIPRAPTEGLPIFEIEAVHIRFRRLALASSEYARKYWQGAPGIAFTLDAPSVIPFRVEPTGSLLGIELLWGCEVDGNQHEQFIEFFKLFGSEAVKPRSLSEIRDEAFLDFVSTVNVIEAKDTTAPRSFTSMLKALRESVKDTVLILGSYAEKDHFYPIRDALASFGYNGVLLSDHEDVPEQSNAEKMMFAAMCSAFIVALDDSPSGHIAELQSLLDRPIRPVIVIRSKGAPSTRYLDDSIRTSGEFKVHEAGITARELAEPIRWAREKVRRKTAELNRINSWRKK